MRLPPTTCHELTSAQSWRCATRCTPPSRRLRTFTQNALASQIALIDFLLLRHTAIFQRANSERQSVAHWGIAGKEGVYFTPSTPVVGSLRSATLASRLTYATRSLPHFFGCSSHSVRMRRRGRRGHAPTGPNHRQPRSRHRTRSRDGSRARARPRSRADRWPDRLSDGSGACLSGHSDPWLW